MWIALMIPALLAATSWRQLLDSRRVMVGESVYQLISDQLTAYEENRSPKIADPTIKSIPIIESGELLFNCVGSTNNRISMLPTPQEIFSSPNSNSGLPAASFMRQTIFTRLEQMIEALDALASNFGYAPGQMQIKVFEGLRDLKTQKMLFTNKLNEIKASNPQLTDTEAFAETSKWVSPVENNIPVHSTGGAVDIRIWDNLNNQFLDVGLFGVIWGANLTAPTFSEALTDIQKLNRLYVLMAASLAGLVNYSYEHWHFSYGDRYYCFWQSIDTASYGPVAGDL